MKIRCVASLHLNPWACGVAKFNAALADRLHVPHILLDTLRYVRFVRSREVDAPDTYPLISVKPAELGNQSFAIPAPYLLFLHGLPRDRLDDGPIEAAACLFVADAGIARALKPMRPDLIIAHCPSTVPIADLSPMLRLITFGMAHKLATPMYQKLQALLERQPAEYVLGASASIHEGRSVPDDLVALDKALRAIFGARVHLFGYLGDAGLSATLQTATCAVMFFEGGVRANNTTFWAALEHGCPVITNLGPDSPPELAHWENVLDIHRLTEWPPEGLLLYLKEKGRAVAEAYGWGQLVQLLASPLAGESP